jgi:hypothetical protein
MTGLWRQVLRQAGLACAPGGRILLIEHGRSPVPPDTWLNRWLDEGAARHKHTWGCFWNRDILRIVAEVCSCYCCLCFALCFGCGTATSAIAKHCGLLALTSAHERLTHLCP